jgi:aminoglycoside/choline kinase family phosphotransferase
MGPTGSDSRLAALERWVREDLGFAGCPLEAASADASFRRYFRVRRGDDSYILMDAPPDKENLGAFLEVARMLKAIGLNVPVALARNEPEGLLMLTDLGSHPYLPELLAQRDVERLYADAMGALLTMQCAAPPGLARLPVYDRSLLVQEMELLPDWFLARHLDAPVSERERAVLERLEGVLVDAALEQPACFVHRDFHSRNLMVVPEDNPGILDFQDAVSGPITYDLVSLLKDCYVAWPAPRVRAWALEFRERRLAAGAPCGADAATFLRWFDLMGLQRHVKVLGIFARLFYRDGKPQYLGDLPRVLEYARAAAALYPETREFADFLEVRVVPRFAAAQARALRAAPGSVAFPGQRGDVE